MQIYLRLIWKGQSTILALFRIRILGQDPAAPSSPGPFVLLLTICQQVTSDNCVLKILLKLRKNVNHGFLDPNVLFVLRPKNTSMRGEEHQNVFSSFLRGKSRGARPINDFRIANGVTDTDLNDFRINLLRDYRYRLGIINSVIIYRLQTCNSSEDHFRTD